ncbi:hypothetical protein [Bradyrhizobium sp. th.b2]|uniref:hypothetical protein n=1 Tax=Bradyrhizobium sp. th-b2 TaxID=172088 RepID=UPI00040FA251|nr:hypothetical protein [Bradyrhizobium sp. th.b2]
MLFSIIMGLLPKFGTSFLDWLNKKTDADLEKFKTAVGGDIQLNAAELRYKVEVARMAADMRKDDREHWFTAWMVPVAFAVLFFHVAAVVFDSIPLFGHEVGTWKVAALPAPYDTMQVQIVLTICGVAGLSSLKKIFSR